jgi:ParB-like chromosome segregation protein Spo0J
MLGVILKKGLSVRETEKAVLNLKKDKKDPAHPQKDSYILDLENMLSSRLMTKIQINPSKNSGSLEIKYKGRDELDRLVQILLSGIKG